MPVYFYPVKTKTSTNIIIVPTNRDHNQLLFLLNTHQSNAKSDYSDNLLLLFFCLPVLLFLILNGKGEKPIVIRAEIPEDRVPGTPANTFISIEGKGKYFFINVFMIIS